MSKTSLRVLIIDDSPADRAICRHLLQEIPEYDYDVLSAASGVEGLALCRSAQPDCVLLDYLLPDLTGVEFIQALGKEEPALLVPIIMLTSYGNDMVVAEAMRSGAADYLPKDVLSVKSLKRTVTNAVEKHHLRMAVENHHHMLEQTNTELLRKNEEIRSFYHLLSHELRTPLTAIREFIAILLDGLAGPLNDTQREYLGIAKESCDQITLGLNDLLDVARLDTGKLHVEPCPQVIGPIVQRAVASMAPMAEEAEIRLRHHIMPGLAEVMCDARRIIQVLTNLLRNALKFTAAGGEVVVEVTEASQGVDGVLVAVRDTGRGIAPEQCRYIFDRLYQARREDAAFEGGLGLGLYICREVIELHRGEIWVESTPGTGSTFSFTLPYHGVHTASNGVSEEVSA